MDKPTAISLPAPVCEMQNVNITSASAIVKKVDQCLSKLYPEKREEDSKSDPNPSPTSVSAAVATVSTATSTSTTTSDFPAISITAKSATASKAITVAEIVKRRIGEKGGKWYQYTALSSVTQDLPESQQEQQPREKKRKNNNGKEKEEDPSALPAGKALSKKRKVPLLTIYISRTPMPELQRLHGEQSGP